MMTGMRYVTDEGIASVMETDCKTDLDRANAIGRRNCEDKYDFENRLFALMEENLAKRDIAMLAVDVKLYEAYIQGLKEGNEERRQSWSRWNEHTVGMRAGR